MLTTIILNAVHIGCADISYVLRETTKDTGDSLTISAVEPQQSNQTSSTNQVEDIEDTGIDNQSQDQETTPAMAEDTADIDQVFQDTGLDDTGLDEQITDSPEELDNDEDEDQDDWELFAESDFASGGLYPFATNGCAGIGCPTISNGALYMAGDWNSITVDPSYGDWFASGTSWAVEIDIINPAEADHMWLRFASSPGHSVGNGQGSYGIIPLYDNLITLQAQATYRIEAEDYNGYVYENGVLISEDVDMGFPSSGAQHIGIAFQRNPVNWQPTGTTVSAVRVYSK
tara:strand:- start:2723 stop:3583 length:861 start_codon:yes stop_codon:yes gene_type:complete